MECLLSKVQEDMHHTVIGFMSKWGVPQSDYLSVWTMVRDLMTQDFTPHSKKEIVDDAESTITQLESMKND